MQSFKNLTAALGTAGVTCGVGVTVSMACIVELSDLGSVVDLKIH